MANVVVLKNLSVKGLDFAAGVYLSETLSPPPSRFLFGLVSQFCIGSQSGQKQRVKLLQNMVSNTTQQFGQVQVVSE
jgi:hypothetical protein